MDRLVFTSVFSLLSCLPLVSRCQYIEKVVFDNKDSADGFYLAVPPRSGTIKGTLVLLSNFYNLEEIVSETKLHNVAYAEGNDLLTVFASMKQKLYADPVTVDRLKTIMQSVMARYRADTSKFAMGGFDFAANIALRYTELSYQRPGDFLVRPKAVFAIAGPVDLFELWHQCERQVKKNYNPGSVGDAKYLMDAMTRENGTIYTNRDAYSKLSPFDREQPGPGNEKFLRNVAVRLYYDTDIDWQLKSRRNSFYDTDMPSGSELINRLLLMGNEQAEFVSAPQRGQRSNGIRNPVSLSVVDEAGCIKWLKEKLDIFDINTWIPPYQLSIPAGWSTERFPLPPDFAPQIHHKGVEDLRFPPGWGDTTSDQHWSYAFLWWLDGLEKVNEHSLNAELEMYYTGLVGRNIQPRKIPANKLVPVFVAIKAGKVSPGDAATYSGTISILDYIAQRPITLNCVVHVKSCSVNDHTAVFFEISPKPSSDGIWRELNEIGESFGCPK